ncbi:MAG: hypothetical protein ABIJ11_07500, partial [Elusimicrobiota bacterium]
VWVIICRFVGPAICLLEIEIHAKPYKEGILYYFLYPIYKPKQYYEIEKVKVNGMRFLTGLSITVGVYIIVTLSDILLTFLVSYIFNIDINLFFQ